MTSPAKQVQTSTTVTRDVITDTYSATRVTIQYMHLEYYISIKQELKTIPLYKVICGHVISHIITIYKSHMVTLHTTGKWWAHYSSTQVQGARQ